MVTSGTFAFGKGPYFAVSPTPRDIMDKVNVDRRGRLNGIPGGISAMELAALWGARDEVRGVCILLGGAADAVVNGIPTMVGVPDSATADDL